MALCSRRLGGGHDRHDGGTALVVANDDALLTGSNSLCGRDPTFGLLRPLSRVKRWTPLLLERGAGCQMQFRLRIYDPCRIPAFPFASTLPTATVSGRARSHCSKPFRPKDRSPRRPCIWVC